jgi:hypothetical protein
MWRMNFGDQKWAGESQWKVTAVVKVRADGGSDWQVPGRVEGRDCVGGMSRGYINNHARILCVSNTKGKGGLSKFVHRAQYYCFSE